jgi:uncharacterized protein
MDDKTSVSISVSAEARAALLCVVEEHGPLMFHTSGGRVGGRRFPICLPIDALRLGARDHLLGKVEGIPIYEMEDRDGGATCCAQSYMLDIEPGPAIGFSIAAGPGKRFTLVSIAGEVCDSDGNKT